MKKVIFDVDGVLLSEKRYFDVSALVLWEWYYSEKYLYLGHETVTSELSDDAIDSLRRRFWKDDAILLWLKKSRRQQQLGYGPCPSRRHTVAPFRAVCRTSRRLEYGL